MERSLQAIASDDPPSLLLRLPAVVKRPRPVHELPHGRRAPLPDPGPNHQPGRRMVYAPGNSEMGALLPARWRRLSRVADPAGRLPLAGCVSSRTAASQKRNTKCDGSSSGRFGATRLAGMVREHAETNEAGLPQSCHRSRTSMGSERAELTPLGSRPTWLERHPSTPPACAARSVARTGARQSQSCGASRS
jgi:hypothetical protein